MRQRVAQRGGAGGHFTGLTLDHTRGTVYLRSHRGQRIGFALHGVDQQGELIEHAIEALLEKPEFVGVTGVGAGLQVAAFHLRHALTSAADTGDEPGGHLNHLLGYDHQ